jgi:hypothetical protein
LCALFAGEPTFAAAGFTPAEFSEKMARTDGPHAREMEHTMGDFTKHQQKIIKNYYDNRESIALQKVQEFVTELYLSEGKKRVKYWKSIAGHLEKLGVDKKTIDHLISQDKPELVATLVKKLMDKQ